VVDDTPVTAEEFIEEFARLLGARPPGRAPVFLARLVAGDTAVEYLTSSTRTSNARFRRETGWSPRFPSYREGLGQVACGMAE
jgi:nucleoside-diphosphate-sugar epimerase